MCLDAEAVCVLVQVDESRQKQSVNWIQMRPIYALLFPSPANEPTKYRYCILGRERMYYLSRRMQTSKHRTAPVH